ncbi:ABC transporter ATP-binding protein [Micrococcus luteus]|uniref:ABC transporter ATP-binding protein n=1 Tax=Micrococcus luteus TaxID=1270 RepID=UPI00097F1F1D|nr:ABC transporter ATP-binding protein [Micrococcus luteus]MCV7527107.1 ABC transporter ATP-binding protein [Micrococcus luteus]QAV28673.1 ABC transporter ATP-binding protein [Micrococcus luteus]SJN24607.1 Methionine ABC transporter ATP-binding protein [Micrococcus luteus Mu201]
MDTPRTSHPASPTTPGPVTPGPGTPSSSATTTTAPAVCARGLTRAYGRGDAQVHALRGVDVDFASGAFTAIMGPSGSGKSTLMHCLAGLDAPTSGSVRIGGTEITGLDDTALTRLRRDRVGFVFQAFNLVPTLTAEQNIVLPLELAGRAPDRAWLDEITRTLGLADRLGHRPHELSGGQQQRVAVARALLTRPDVVFGDEPTGNLDTATSAEVLGLLRRSAREMGQTVIMVTHDPVAASAADRVVLLADGRLAGELVDPTVESVTAALTALSAPAEGGVR